MRVVATSDLHGDLPSTPECDLLLLGGDVCPMSDHSIDYQAAWLLREFSPWLQQQPARHKIWIAGNHDFICQVPSFQVDPQVFGGHYLQDSGLEIEGLHIWGTPWVPMLRDWAFYASNEEARQHFQQIPPETDIILSHGPVAGILDRVGQQNVGSAVLGSRMQAVAPALFVSGHIHEQGGQAEQIGETLFANASLKNERYDSVYPLLLFDLQRQDDRWSVKQVF